MPSLHTPRQNRLLAILATDGYERLAPQLELIALPRGHVLHEPGDTLRYVCFPTTAILSLLHVMQDGTSAEVAMVGREGVIGMALIQGGETSPSRAVVQNAGHGYRLSSQGLKDELLLSAPLQRLLLRYTQTLLTQMAQTAVCTRYHSLDQQFCRWLLHFSDRVDSNELQLTQELIANLLGVRRESVSAIATNAQKIGLIEYQRGRITLLDRPGLEARACECYQLIRQETERLLVQWREP